MYQIAIGDKNEWIIIEGASIAAPFRKAACFFSFGKEKILKEKIEIQMAGNPTEITEAIKKLEKISLKIDAYLRGEYAHPQRIRIKKTSAGNYFYLLLSEMHLAAQKAAHLKETRGSYLVEIIYTRSNHIDGDKVELELNGEFGLEVKGGFDMINHWDNTAALGNYFYIDPAKFSTDLPASLRIELENTYGANKIHDLYFGIYHHPSNYDHTIFYAFATDMTGGTQYYNANAINDYYRRIIWTSTAWTASLNYPAPVADTKKFDGRTYRPIMHLYNSHAYTDLFMRITLKRGTYTLETCDPVYSDPDFDYVIFPPIQIPPNRILREEDPHHVELEISFLKEDGATAQIDVDCLQLLPLDYSATFKGFYDMGSDCFLIDDCYLGMTNVQIGFANKYEIVAHQRQGGALLLYPDEYSMIFLIIANENNTQDILRTSTIKAYYRPRYKTL